MYDSLWGVFALMVGSAVGSFLNVVADRVPSGGSVVRPRSYCDSCRRPLSSLELVPIISYLWLRGKCRHCGVVIPPRFMIVEAVTALLFTLVYLRYGLGVEWLILVIAISLLLVVTIIDLEHGLILNKIILPAIVVLVLLAPFWPELGISRSFLGGTGMLGSLYSSLVAGGGAFLVFFAITLLFPQGMGGGDVKLAAVIGLLVGFPQVLLALWLAIVSGGLVAIVLLVSRRRGRKDSMPFGPFMALSTVVVLLMGAEIVTWYQTSVADWVRSWT